MDAHNWLRRVVDWYIETQNFGFCYFFLDKPFDKEGLSEIPKFELDEKDDYSVNLTVYWGAIVMLSFILLFFTGRKNPQARSPAASF